MIHNKSCFGRTFKQDTQASELDGKSWNDDKFYENLRLKKKAVPLWQPQWKKPVIEKQAWSPMGPEECRRGSDIHPLDLLSQPEYSMIPGNTWNSE